MKKFISFFSTGIAACSLLMADSAKEPEIVHPVVVLGGGISGLTSAIYLGQAGLSPLVVEGSQPGGALTQSHSVRNWPGFKDISGSELMNEIHSQAEESGTLFYTGEVVDVDFSQSPLTIGVRNPFQPDKVEKIKAQSVLIAMGTKPNTLSVPGEEVYWTKGVYTCALCDGPLYKDKTVAIVGGGNSAIAEAHYLSNIARKVILLVRGQGLRSVDQKLKDELLAKPNVEIRVQTAVQEIKGDGEKMTHLLVKSGEQTSAEEITADALFLAIGSTPNSALFNGKLNVDDHGFILIDNDKQTSAKGVFAIGDITPGKCKQAICAAGEAAESSLYVTRYLAASTAKPPKALEGVIEITSVEQFQKEVQKDGLPVLVDFYATWCGPCKVFSPLFESMASTFSGKIKFLKVNVEKCASLSQHYQIRAMPTLLVLDKQGKVIDKKVGTVEIGQFSSSLEKIKEKNPQEIDAFLAKN